MRGGNMTTLTSRLRAGVLGIALAGGVAVWPAYACGDERGEGSKQSDIGAVTGLAVGAAAGGPVGGVLGAAAGALLGERYHRQGERRGACGAQTRPQRGGAQPPVRECRAARSDPAAD